MVQAQVGAVLPPGDPELLREAAEEVQAAQLRRAPQCAVAQVGRAQLAGSGQRMGRADHRVDGLQPHQSLGETSVAAVRQRMHSPEPQIGVTVQQGPCDRRPVPARTGFQAHPAERLRRLGDGPHRRVQMAPRVDPYDGQGARHGRDRVLARRERPPRGGQKPFPGLGQPDAALTLEQTYGQQRLQSRDALGQRLLADAEMFGGAPEMQPLRGLGERTDQDEVKIHAAEHR